MCLGNPIGYVRNQSRWNDAPSAFQMAMANEKKLTSFGKDSVMKNSENGNILNVSTVVFAHNLQNEQLQVTLFLESREIWNVGFSRFGEVKRAPAIV